MTIAQRTMITLLKSAITGEKYDLPEAFEFPEVVKLLKKHGLLSMGYIGAVNCGIPKTDPLMQTMFTYYCRSVVVSQRQLDKVQEVFDAFDKAGIDYMPLKGTIMKHLYPSHELRPMGDADILIRVEQYDRIKPIMVELGFVEGQEMNHEIHWLHKDIHIELHKCVIPAYYQDLYAYYDSGWKFALSDTGNRYVLSKEDLYIYLFSHFAKHFCSGGIGCRHVIDLWIYSRRYPQLDEVYICRELDKLFLLDFYQNMKMFLDGWFDDVEMNEKSQLISDFVFQSGMWGTLHSRDLAGNVKMYQTVGKVTPGKFMFIFCRIFPNYDTMKYQYPVLRRHPILLPIIWVVRWFRIAFQNPSLIVRRFKMLENRNNERMLAWEQKMSDVGLRYWHDSEK